MTSQEHTAVDLAIKHIELELADLQPELDVDSTSHQNLRDALELLRGLQEADWNAGRGCKRHRAMRSGSCHECAMLQPEPRRA